MPWLLNCIYVLLCVLIAPVIAYRRFRYGKYREGWNQKLWGSLPERNSDQPCVWFHAVSVGEVLQLKSVVSELRTSRPDCDVVISTTTSTGQAVANEKFPDCQVCYFPLDFTWSVRRAIARVRPSVVVLVELELWPNFIWEVSRLGIPLALINGRMSEHSHRGYRRIRPLLKNLLSKFSTIAVQNGVYASRLLDLGALPEKLQVTGSVKFDHIETNRGNDKTKELRDSFRIASDAKVFVAGSTQAPEENYAIDAWLEARKLYPELRLILVPRHKERFEEVAELVLSRSLPLVRRSRGDDATDYDAVILLDTLGELGACWGLADVAFVGGSLTNRGGQNMIEPAGYGAAVTFGPNTQNFQDVVTALLEHEAALVVHDQAAITETLELLLRDTTMRTQMGQAAQRFVLTQQGATAKTVASICDLLPKSSQRRAAA
ncbi:MAG: 3-deoxy-D-manno-octulosonic acid transferase [Planctomycetaceae bacterium]|nr:3-deoxy-D-manno-octulosonic acid transferase [Planctomycetaceae bacterium]